MKKTFYKLMMLLMLAILVVSACANQQPTTVEPATTDAQATSGTVAEGHLLPEHAVNLSFQTHGIVDKVNVKIGDSVKEGDVLARLSNASQAEAQLAAAKLDLVTAQQDLDKLNRTGGENLASTWTAYLDAQIVRADAGREWEDLNLDDIDNRIEDAQTEIQDRQDDLNDAQDEFDKYKNLDQDNDKRKTAEDELETAQNDYNEAVRKLEEITRERDTVRAALDAALAAEAEAKYQYEISSDGVNKDQLDLAQARLENAKAQVAAAESNLSNYILTAPFDGVVAEVAVAVGDQVSAESRAIAVADASSWKVETTDVTELEVVNVAVGQKVTFTADALSDVIMDGIVTEISQSSYTQSGDVIYTVRIKVDEVDPRVKWGMTVEISFVPLEN
jgi:multidrug resistance efflux pump